MGDRAIAGAFALKLVAFALIIVISVFLGTRIPRVREAAERGLEDVRRDPSFRTMDLLSRANLGLVLVVLLISILM